MTPKCGSQQLGLCALIASMAPSAAAALQQDSTIIVTGSRIEEAGPETTILSQEEIMRQQPVTLLEPLDRIAGVRAFSKGGLSYLSVRGGEPNFTLVLIDGIRVNDPTNSRGGAFDFEQIEPAAVERIEVAPTALSAVHGADALSGAVHLKLRTPTPGNSGISGRAFADSRGARGLSATADYGWSDGGILFGGSLFDSGDLYDGVDLDRRQAFAKARQGVGNFTLNALFLHAQAERRAFPEDSGGPRFAVVRDREDRDNRFTLAGLEVVGSDDARFRPHVAVNWSRQKIHTDTPAIAPGVLEGVPAILADSRFDRVEAIADVRIRLNRSVTVAAGASIVREDADSRGSIDLGFPLPTDFAVERNMPGLFGELALDLRTIRLTAAIRYDDPSGERGVVTIRAGAHVAVWSRTKLFADYAEGYKLPSLFALAFPIGANPALRPERSRTITVGIEQQVGRGRLRASLFDSRFRNLVDFDAELFLHVNRGHVQSRGVEIEGDIPIGADFVASGALTYMDVDNDPGAPPLRSRPKWQGSMNLDWRVTDRVTISLGGRFNSRYFDSSVPTGLIVQGGHGKLDATARFEVSKAAALVITGTNLASESYFDAVGFPAPSRTVRIGLEGRL